jgi:hypothetical protein
MRQAWFRNMTAAYYNFTHDNSELDKYCLVPAKSEFLGLKFKRVRSQISLIIFVKSVK